MLLRSMTAIQASAKPITIITTTTTTWCQLTERTGKSVLANTFYRILWQMSCAATRWFALPNVYHMCLIVNMRRSWGFKYFSLNNWTCLECYTSSWQSDCR